MIPEIDMRPILPMTVVALGVLVLPLAEVLLARRRTVLGAALTRERRSNYLAALSTLLLVVAFVMTLDDASGSSGVFNADHPMIVMDRVSQFLCATVLLSAILTVLVSMRYLADIEANYGEYYALLLASVVGMMFLCAATDLLMLFLALELMSIPIYALVGIRRGSLHANESALKYFLIGSFASGILLYGCALLYGATGSLSLEAVGAAFDPESPLALLGAGLVLVGLAFKIASVPFHQWAPDTYEGAPTTISGFMATAVKVAAFGALLRVVGIALLPVPDLLYWVLWALAVLSMTVGNVMALIQPNLKRMLAYSSIAHAGYLLVGIVVGGERGVSAVLFYLVVYTFMTIGAFTVVAVLARDGEEQDRIENLAGLAGSRPFLAWVMTLCMFSLAGIPFTAGFMGKFQLFSAAIKKGIEGPDIWLWVLAIAGVLNSAISLGYYLRVPVAMFMQPAPEGREPDRPGTLDIFVLAVCGAAVILLGVAPQNVLVIFGEVNLIDLVRLAAGSLTGLN